MSHRREAGFTLLEVIVALTVFGFLLVGLGQTTRFGVTAWRRSAHLAENKTDLESVDRILRTLVENFSTSADAARSPIEGSGDKVSGLTRLRVPGAMTPERVEAGVAVSGSRLVLRWRRYNHETEWQSPEPPAEEMLLDQVSGVSIQYWRRPGVWVSRWSEPGLPLLVRFRIVSAKAGATPWPDIVVAPLLSRP